MTASHVSSELYFDILQLFAAYADCLDSGDYDLWPELFTEDATYRIVPRENHDRNLPIALFFTESRDMMKDRVYAIKESLMTEPRFYRHINSAARIVGHDTGVIKVKSNVLLVESMIEKPTEIVLSGCYLDTLVRQDGRLLFQERICVVDTLLIPTSLIVPA